MTRDGTRSPVRARIEFLCPTGAALVRGGMLEAQGQFRRVKGYREIPILIAAMDRHFHPEMLAGKEEVA